MSLLLGLPRRPGLGAIYSSVATSGTPENRALYAAGKELPLVHGLLERTDAFFCVV